MGSPVVRFQGQGLLKLFDGLLKAESAHIQSALFHQIITAFPDLQLSIYVAHSLVKIRRIVGGGVFFLVIVRQLFIGVPVPLLAVQGFLKFLHSQNLHALIFLAQPAVVVESRGGAVDSFCLLVLCQGAFVLFSVQIDMSPYHAVLHPVGILVYGLSKVLKSRVRVIVIPV